MPLTALGDLEQDFKTRAIDFSLPGFYDHPNFLIAEKNDNTYLEKYAEYVLQKEYDQKYIERAKKEIPFIASLLYSELEKDGRLGACIDVSMALSRFLELEGFWNYINKSALTISFPKESKIETKYFWPFDDGNFAAAHSYVVAPPFHVVDLTIGRQHYSGNETQYLPTTVLAMEVASASYDIEDIISPTRRFFMGRVLGMKGKALIDHAIPRLKSVSERFRPILVGTENSGIKYVQYAISAPDSPLTEMVSLNLNGRTAFEIYEQVIVPRLKEFRSK